MVTEWLTTYMFAGDEDRESKALSVSSELANYEEFNSHGRRLNANRLRSLGLNITMLESDQRLQDLVLSVHHAVNHTMNHTGVIKIVENHLGRAFIRRASIVHVPIPQEP